MGETVEVRTFTSLEDLEATAALLDRIWGEELVLRVELLRALTAHGNPVLGAFVEGELVGAQMGFLGRAPDGELILHSHVTGVLEEHQHTGVGFALKAAQRDWSLANGIATVTWTFDPTIGRNAYFNLRKLGASAERFFRNFYGEMDDAFNLGERTDRLEIVWRLRDPRVVAAMAGERVEVDASEAVPLLDGREGRPLLRPGADAPRLLIRVPRDHVALRREDPGLAEAWRDAVADAFDETAARGLIAVDFHPDAGYVLERR